MKREMKKKALELKFCNKCMNSYVTICSCNSRKIQSYGTKHIPQKKYLGIARGIELEVDTQTPLGTTLGVPTYDSSINGVEYKVWLSKIPNHRFIKELINIRVQGGKATADCGLHIHLPVLESSLFLDVMKKLQRLWQYCFPIRFGSCFVTYATSGHYGFVNGREWFIGYDGAEYQQVEIRLHYGTLNPFRIFKWIKTVEYIRDTADALIEINPQKLDVDYYIERIYDASRDIEVAEFLEKIVYKDRQTGLNGDWIGYDAITRNSGTIVPYEKILYGGLCNTCETPYFVFEYGKENYKICNCTSTRVYSKTNKKYFITFNYADKITGNIRYDRRKLVHGLYFDSLEEIKGLLLFLQLWGLKWTIFDDNNNRTRNIDSTATFELFKSV